MSATQSRPSAAELRADLTAQLRESNTLDPLRAGEADAVITHFLQSINHDAPLLAPSLRREFCEHIGRPLPAKARATKRPSVREGAEPYQTSLDLGWDVPYPPHFTVIELRASILSLFAFAANIIAIVFAAEGLVNRSIESLLARDIRTTGTLAVLAR